MTRPVSLRGGALAVLAGLGTAGAVTLLPGTGAVAAGPGVSGWPGVGAEAGDTTAISLLRRATVSASATAYSGVQYLSSWSARGASTSVVLDIDHVPGRGSMVQVRATPGSAPVRVFEADASPGPSDLGDSSLIGAPTSALTLLEDKYDVTVGTPDQVAGRTADVIDVRRSNGTLAARLWLDAASGLLLRREVYDNKGRMTRASAYIELRVGSAGAGRAGIADDTPAAVTPQSPPQPWGRQLSAADLAALRRRGWTVPKSLPGGLQLYDARSEGSGSGSVLHLSFSDGLSSVSLFEQKGRLDTRHFADWRRARIGDAKVLVLDGMPQRMVWASKGKVYTLLADAPEDTVEAVIDRLPHHPTPTGILSRLARGLGRVGSWFNPFS